MREKEKLANMELALANINDKLLEMSELASISTALLEAATMPSEDALREPEAEEESEAAREKPGSGGA